MAGELGGKTMDTLTYICEKHGVKPFTPSPIHLSMGRFKCIPRLFRELGFRTGAEIGVFEGQYSRWLLKGIPGLKLYGIDAWTSYQGYKDFRANTIDQAYDKAVANTKGFDCELIREYSDKAAERFADESLDFVFIDGNHSYEWVVWDLAKWARKVRKGGIVYGHDYRDYSDTSRWREMNVIPAIEGWIKAYKIAPWFVITNNRDCSWLYIK